MSTAHVHFRDGAADTYTGIAEIVEALHKTPVKLTPAPAAKDFAEQPLKDKKV